MKAGSVAVGYLDPGKWSACFGQSLCRLYLTDASGSRRIIPNGRELRNFASSGGLVAARNRVVKTFLDETECEWLFMIDSDMGFEADIVDRLVAAADRYERPIVGALCFALRRMGIDQRYAEKYAIVPTVYSFVERETEVGFLPQADYPVDSLVQVGATGAAALLVHRRALGKIRKTHGDVWFDPITHPKGPTTFSEDLSFCVRAASCDLPVFVHTGVQTCHDKGGVFLDEDSFARQQALTREEPVDAD